MAFELFKTTERTPDEVYLDTSDEACLPFGGFHSGETIINPKGDNVIIRGVAPGNEGHNVLWYEILHPKTKGKICYWGGCTNLLEAGFRKVA